MELGQKLRQARLEAGLSQRQLCGGIVTRNMLSQIENGSARPSMDTLAALAARLGKGVSYFLEEQAVTSPNQACMASARQAYRGGNAPQVLRILESYRQDDPVFDDEMHLLTALALMDTAESALEEDRLPYAAQLLAKAADAGSRTPYYGPESERRRLLLLGQTGPEASSAVAAALPADDRELLIRAEAALRAGEPLRCARLLDAACHRAGARWYFLRGQAYLAAEEFAAAAEQFLLAEQAGATDTDPRLEECYRELGDFRKAYEYACRRRQK